jgi:16S rRNA (cytidine1402-2'-O)-methyltransferase
MSLKIVALPIGNPEDITLRAIEALKSCDLVIGEDRKPLHRLLARLDLRGKPYELLNEHTKDQDLEFLLKECAEKDVALVSDCGTPVFSDPGSSLIALCRNESISVTPLPGASALMCIISMSSHKLTEFDFLGFPPRDKSERAQYLKSLAKVKRPFIIMDTPYRLQALVDSLAEVIPNRNALIGMDMTSENEEYLEGSLKNLKQSLAEYGKREFMLLVYAQ